MIELDLSTVKPCVAGPKRPQDRIELPELKDKILKAYCQLLSQGGYEKREAEASAAGLSFEAQPLFSTASTRNRRERDARKSAKSAWSEDEMVTNRPFTEAVDDPTYIHEKEADIVLAHGSVVIAAITSCTNTSNPSVMMAAGLLAKKAIEKGLKSTLW